MRVSLALLALLSLAGSGEWISSAIESREKRGRVCEFSFDRKHVRRTSANLAAASPTVAAKKPIAPRRVLVVVALSVPSKPHSTAWITKCATSIAIERRKIGRGTTRRGAENVSTRRCWHHHRSPLSFSFASPLNSLPAFFHSTPQTARSFITVKDQKFVDENCNDYVVAG